VYANGVNVLGENVNTINIYSDALEDATNDAGVKVNSYETKLRHICSNLTNRPQGKTTI